MPHEAESTETGLARATYEASLELDRDTWFDPTASLTVSNVSCECSAAGLAGSAKENTCCAGTDANRTVPCLVSAGSESVSAIMAETSLICLLASDCAVTFHSVAPIVGTLLVSPHVYAALVGVRAEVFTV